MRQLDIRRRVGAVSSVRIVYRACTAAVELDKTADYNRSSPVPENVPALLRSNWTKWGDFCVARQVGTMVAFLNIITI